MASAGGERGEPEPGEDGEETSHEPRECMACRGTGQVVSSLGGTPSMVSCPWCDGSGVRPADVDAQAKWQHSRGEAQEDAPQTPPAPADAPPEPAA